MGTATLKVAPSALGLICAALPSGARIVGSVNCENYVALLLEGACVPDGPVTLLVEDDGLQRTIKIKPAQ